jgi:hypothetical protein
VSRASEYQGAVQAGRDDLASTRKEGAAIKLKEGDTWNMAGTKAQTAKTMQDSMERRDAVSHDGERLGGGGKLDRMLEQGQPRDVAAANLRVRGCLIGSALCRAKCGLKLLSLLSLGPLAAAHWLLRPPPPLCRFYACVTKKLHWKSHGVNL